MESVIFGLAGGKAKETPVRQAALRKADRSGYDQVYTNEVVSTGWFFGFSYSVVIYLNRKQQIKRPVVA
jgi:hypothetical protein